MKVPDGVDSLDAAPLSCAGVTVYKAVKSSEVGPSQLCAIFGGAHLRHRPQVPRHGLCRV